MIETQTVSPSTPATSRGRKLPSPADLAIRANYLRLGFECLAKACPSDVGRRHWRHLSDVAAIMQDQCLKPVRAGVR